MVRRLIKASTARAGRFKLDDAKEAEEADSDAVTLIQRFGSMWVVPRLLAARAVHAIRVDRWGRIGRR